MATEFEEMSRHAGQVQKRVLRRILQDNATCEYLRTCGLGSPSELARVDDEELVRRFKERVPLASHSHIMPFIQRILDGDTSPILTCAPIRGMCLSSGTSQGCEKYIPYFDGLRTGTLEVARIAAAFRDRVYPLTPGARILEFNFTGSYFTTSKGGLRVGTATTLLTHDDAYKMRQKNSLLNSCSPDEVVLARNCQQGMYCHLLCGLVYATEVEVISAIFAYALVEALRTLEVEWQSLCHDIKFGHLDNKITDPSLRAAIMSKVLTHPNIEAADKVIAACTSASLRSSWKGMVEQLWPRCKYVLSIVTGSMETYVDTLQHYMGDRVALVSADYGATEGWVATNINPCAKPKDVSFTVIPSLGYFEFIPLSKPRFDDYLTSSSSSSNQFHAFKEAKPVDLTEVKVRQEYEIVITTSGGLYRYRLGDVLRVTGFFNCTPQFAYVCRKDVILTINIDKITEEDLRVVMSKVANRIQGRSTMKLVDYTSYADIKSLPPHYIIFWEVEGVQVETSENQKLFYDCATWIDAAFIEPGYVTSRKMSAIGGLELCIVRGGTFKRLLDYFMSRVGASITQYKTPRCILAGSPNMLSILQENTIATFLSSLKF